MGSDGVADVAWEVEMGYSGSRVYWYAADSASVGPQEVGDVC
jgi:hypothetical protein